MSVLESVEPAVTQRLKRRYGNFIGGEFRPPLSGQFFENITPISGEVFCEVPRSNAMDVEAALDAAHAAKEAGVRRHPQRAAILMKIADRMEAHLHTLAVIETIEKGKPLRESLAADIPLAIDQFRYFASGSPVGALIALSRRGMQVAW